MPVDNMLTREELYDLPNDRLRRELIDGSFVMTRCPGRWGTRGCSWTSFSYSGRHVRGRI